MAVRPKPIAWLLLALMLSVHVAASERPGPSPRVASGWIDTAARGCDGNFPCWPTFDVGMFNVDVGGQLFFMANATYQFNASVWHAVQIVGMNRTTTVIDGGGRTLFNVTADGVTIANMTLQNAQVAIEAHNASLAVRQLSINRSAVGIDVFPGASGVTVTDVDILAIADALGVRATAADGLVLDRVHVTGGLVGVTVSQGAGFVLTNSTLDRALTSGLEVQGARGPRIGPNNTVVGAGDRGAWVNASTAIVVRGNEFRASLQGLNVSESVNVTVEGNLFEGNTGPPIPRAPGAPAPLGGGGGGGWFWQTDPVLIANNTVLNNDVGIGIGGDRSTDYVIRGNDVRTNGGAGILLTQGASRIDVSGVFENNANGIAMDNATAVTVHDARASGNGAFGVLGSFATNVTVRNSTLNGNGLAGGWFWQTDPSGLTGNVISGNGGPGIVLTNTTDFDVRDNRVENNAIANVRLEGAIRTVLSGNQILGAPASVVQLGGDVASSGNLLANATWWAFQLATGARLASTNDTFAGGAAEFDLTAGSRAIALNDSFATRAFAAGAQSTLVVRWFLDVAVVDSVGNPVPGATVRAFDRAGAEVFNGTADGVGRRRWIVVDELDIADANRTEHTPHDARAYLTGPDEGSVAVRMNASRAVTIELVNDTAAPSIGNVTASPNPQEQFGVVDVSARVIDPHLASVVLNVGYPDGTWANGSMSDAGGGWFRLGRSYSMVGTYGYQVVARDTFGNVANALGTFRIEVANVGPAITNVVAAPDPAEAGAVVNVTATIQDPDGVASARIDVRQPDNSVVSASLAPGGGNTWFFARAYTPLGGYQVTITATDGNGTFPKTSTAFASFTVQDATPPTAQAGPDQAVPVGTTVAFDGSGSSDNTILVNYTWDIGGFARAYGVTVSHRFTQPGAVRVTLTVRDLGGNVGSDELLVTVLDVTLPTIANAAATPDPVEAPATTVVTFTATDDDAVLDAWVEGWDPGNAYLGNQTAYLGGGVFAPTTWTIVPLGSYRFVISVMDRSGNRATQTLTVSARDTTQPQIPAAGAQPDPQRIGARVTVWARVLDPYLASVRVAVRDPLGAPVGNLTMVYNGSAARNETSVAVTILGSYAYTIWAADTTGNVASRSGTFRCVDVTSPTIASVGVAPTPQDVGGVVNVSASVTDDVSLNTPRIAYFDPLGAPDGSGDMAFSPADARWYHVRAYAALGVYSFTIFATDGSGNPAQASGLVPIVDRARPTVSDLRATPARWEVGVRVVVTANTSDNVGVQRVTVQVAGSTGLTVSNNSMTCDTAFRVCSAALTGLAADTYTVRVWANDASNNHGSASTGIEVLAGAAPTANAGPDVAIDAGGTAAFDGTGSTDDFGIVGYLWQFTYDGAPVNLTGTTPSFRFDTAGTYEVTLTVEDLAGHRSSDAVTVRVNVRAGATPLEPWVYALLAGALALLLLGSILLGRRIGRRKRAERLKARERNLGGRSRRSPTKGSPRRDGKDET